MRIPCDISLIAQSILTLVILERESVNYHTVRKRQILRHCAVSGTSVCFLVLKVDRAWSLKLSLYRQDVSNSKLLLSVQLTRGIRQCSNFLDYCTITKIGEMSLRELGITLADKTMRQSAVIVTAPREANKPVFTPFFMVSIFVCFVEVF